jgi:protein O-GlcNAc transferase
MLSVDMGKVVQKEKHMNMHTSLQSALESFQAGDIKRAEEICKNILSIQPENPEILYLLGVICFESGNYDSAIQHIQKSLLFNALNADAFHFLGMAFQQKRQTDQAILHYRKTIDLNPDYSEAYNNLGNLLKEKGLIDEAILNYQKTVLLNPGLAVAYRNLGVCMKEKGMVDEAILYYQKAIAIDPLYATAYNLLGIALKEQDKLDEAMLAYENALRLNPHLADAHSNLGSIFQMRGQLDKAEAYYRQAVQIKPDAIVPRQNLLFAMLFNDHHTARDIFSEHVKFARRFAKPSRFNIAPYSNKKIADRKLRIGYVSPDFKKHSVASFIEPILASYDRERFETFCYSTVLYKDEVTERLERYADHWQDIAGMSDEKAADLIRADEIDILIDLAGHTAHNGVLLFAHRPAPVQVSWIGYPATTGLSAMDYKIVDAYTDPPGMTELFYTEKLIRLPESFLCYMPEKESPKVGPLPALSSGHTTFCSFNTLTKVSPKVMDLWTRILNAVPDSHLILKSKILSDASTCKSVREMFSVKGIEESRIELLGWEPSSIGHLNIYNRVDIALDTFPYNGTTTTCEALWMGIPVVTLSGTAHASRVGVSLLSNIRHPEFIAKKPEEYVEKAVQLASDLTKLESVRQALRRSVALSPLTDVPRFIAHLENCYTTMWEKYCKIR